MRVEVHAHDADRTVCIHGGVVVFYIYAALGCDFVPGNNLAVSGDGDFKLHLRLVLLGAAINAVHAKFFRLETGGQADDCGRCGQKDGVEMLIHCIVLFSMAKISKNYFTNKK